MSLVIDNNALAQGQPGNPREYVVDAAKIAEGGAFTTTDINLADLPAGAVVNATRVKHSESVTDGDVGTISAATARVYFNANAMGSGTLDVFAAPGSTPGTHYITDVTGSGAGKIDDVNVLMLRVTTTGANLSTVTTGKISVWVDYTILAPAVLIA